MRRVGTQHNINTQPALSPDGRRVAYERYLCGSATGHCTIRSIGIWISLASGRGDQHRIARDAHCAVWSPVGDEIAYVAHAPGSAGKRLAVVALGHRRRLLDSRLLAYEAEYVQQTGDGYRLAVLDLSTRHMVLRSPPWLGAVAEPAWSPDGSKVIVVSTDREEFGSFGCLYVSDVRTRRWRPIAGYC